MIKSILKTLAVTTVLAFALSTGVANAQTTDVSGGNDTTGPCSENINDWIIKDSSNTEIKNRIYANNNFDFKVNTGKNWINNNTTVGSEDPSTGNVYGSIVIANDANNGNFSANNNQNQTVTVKNGKSTTTTTSPINNSDPISSDSSNNITGPNSINKNKVYVESNKNVEIENKADFNNDIDVNANTGYNNISGNTSVGEVNTGDVNLNVNISNVANKSGSSYLNVTKQEPLNVSSNFDNSKTGPNSINKNELKVKNNSNLEVENKAYFKNDIDLKANTGGNQIDCNTTVGNVKTGDVSFDVKVLNSAN